MSAKKKTIPKPYLRVGTLLSEDRYRIDELIEDNDLVVSYVGYDIFRKKRVIIRELFPKQIVNRGAGEDQSVSCRLLSYETNFDSMKRHMIDRARKLIALYPVEGIGNIVSYFEENGTVYVVEVEISEAVTLAAFLHKRHSVKFTVEDLLSYLAPLFDTLDKLHAKDIWHGSINPNTVMITPDKKAWLVHFTDPMEDISADCMGICRVRRDGFSPVELYVSEAKPGKAVDIFGLGALMYRFTTGRELPAYYLRINEKRDPKEPKNTRSMIMDFQSDAIMKAVALYEFDRYESAGELLAALAPEDMDLESLHSQQELPRTVAQLPLKFKIQERQRRWYVISLTAIVILFFVLLIPRASDITRTVRINHFYKKFNQANDYQRCMMLKGLTSSQRKVLTNDYVDIPKGQSEEEYSKNFEVKYYDFLLRHYVGFEDVDRTRKHYEYMKIDLRETKAIVTYIAEDGDRQEDLYLKPEIDGSFRVTESYTNDYGQKVSKKKKANKDGETSAQKGR
ncbi:MAG: hypothetical protein K5739_00320 [Lachnospiraceae bacterium]|nr:hypothetical protein [Lachnospiraceae bacterium]